jgi:glycosyltransferase involved in cell wall biosynthesis
LYAILIPVYNDGESLGQLIAALDSDAKEFPSTLDVIVINDGGDSPAAYLQPPRHIRQIHEFSLTVNLGHQRAIAVGLAELASSNQYEAVVVMDGDGEDRPADAFKLLEFHTQQPEEVVVASRATRSEDIRFRLFYRLYQLIFRILTGKSIDFGNFMLLPAKVVSSIVYNPNLWNHLAATILSSNSRIHRLRTSRGQRYKGKSKMNFENLITHGLSAMSVYLTLMFTRMLIALSGLLLLTVSGIGVVVSIRFLTDLAIPGWATNLVGILSIIIFQLILLLLVSAFATLNQRASLVGIPISYIRDYIKEKQILYPRSS